MKRLSLLLSIALLPAAPMAAQAELPLPAAPDTLVALPASNPGWSLDRLIRRAVEGNPQVLARRAASEASKEAAWAARWEFFPAPYVQLQQGGGDMLTSSYKRQEVYGVEQPIWTGGRLRANLKLQKALARSDRYGLAETRQLIAREVVGSWQELMAAESRIRAHEHGVALMEHYLGIMERRVGAGLSAETDRTQVQARLYQARNDLASSRSAHRVALERLRQLVGEPLGGGEVAFLSGAAMAEPPASHAILQRAEAASPVLLRLSSESDAAHEEQRLERSALFPSISVKAEHRNYLYEDDSHAHENIVYASLDYSFGSGLSKLARVRSASDRREQSVQAKAAALRELRAEVVADAEECSRSFGLYRAASLNTKAAGEVLDSYTRLFKAGKRSWLDVLNAARELVQSEVAEGDIVAAYWGSRYRLRLHAMDEALLGVVADKP